MRSTVTLRALVALTAPILIVSGVAAGPAEAAGTKASARYLLSKLGSASEHKAGYDRSKFRHWTDSDGDRCNARYEVLIAEAVRKPRVRSGCRLVGGRWVSRYDGVDTSEPSSFDVDHMVPLNEAWQSGAWKWNAKTRQRFANDLGYKFSLIAVSASSNRSKNDREPHAWMPPRGSYACKYVKQWVAVKWRWNLNVNEAERRYLKFTLKSCGWPRVLKPKLAAVGMGSSSGGLAGGSTGGSSGGGGACAPGYSPCIPPYPPDVDCSDVNGPIYVTGSDPHRFDADGDGVGCEG